MRRGKSSKTDEGDASNKTEGKTETPAAAPHPYENSIKNISVVKTVEQFWSTYNYLKRPNDLSSTTDYHFFRDGIKPTWEDPKNAKGGKWIVSSSIFVCFDFSLCFRLFCIWNLIPTSLIYRSFNALDPSTQGPRESVLGRSRLGIDRWSIPRNPRR